MSANCVYLLPIVIFVWFPATFIATYVVAVLREDVNPLFPYISDTGTFSPESCIFGQMLNAGAILMAVFVYIRHRQVTELCDRHLLHRRIKRNDKIATWFGFLASFGVTIVGNFQETNILSVHLFGAVLAFGLGSVWECLQACNYFLFYNNNVLSNCNYGMSLIFLLQTRISFQLGAAGCNSCTNITRLILSIISTVCFIISFVFGGLAILQFKGSDITKWDKQDGGYEFHITSTITEWIVAFSTVSYVLSFTSEFRDVTLNEPIIQIVINRNIGRTEFVQTIS